MLIPNRCSRVAVSKHFREQIITDHHDTVYWILLCAENDSLPKSVFLREWHEGRHLPEMCSMCFFLLWRHKADVRSAL